MEALSDYLPVEDDEEGSFVEFPPAIEDEAEEQPDEVDRPPFTQLQQLLSDATNSKVIPMPPPLPLCSSQCLFRKSAVLATAYILRQCLTPFIFT